MVIMHQVSEKQIALWAYIEEIVKWFCNRVVGTLQRHQQIVDPLAGAGRRYSGYFCCSLDCV